MPPDSRHEALEEAIDAVESCMQALRLARDLDERNRLSARVKMLLDRAEQIKSNQDWQASDGRTQGAGAATATHDTRTTSRDASRVRKSRLPYSTRMLSKKEQILLLKASFVNGFKFPPWEGPPDPREFECPDGAELFLDTQELQLSEDQEDIFDGWKRPVDALPSPVMLSIDTQEAVPGSTSPQPVDLIQDAAADCSVVASLCAHVARMERGHPSILRSTLYPLDEVRDRPRLSDNGKYILCLNFNGCQRKVVIDDRLPTSSSDRVIHILDRNQPGLLWPALIEKAYLKVRGGYDFPGSNSATDLWILTGWIPEQVFVQSDELDPWRLWQRISTAFSHGDVLVTLGTGTMSKATENALGLAGEHDYALLDLREVDGQRLMLIKNPWCEGINWRGRVDGVERYSRGNTDTTTPKSAEAPDDETLTNSRDLLNADKELLPGTFWMDLSDVMQHFESIYLNWNPGLFAFRDDVHFEWDLSPAEYSGVHGRGRYASLRNHPQYKVVAEKCSTVWLLLCRHFRNAVPADATPEEIENDRYSIELNGHISLFAFSTNGRRVLVPEKAVETGCFVDSPQVLLKLENCPPMDVLTLVPVEHELPAALHSFTISAFATSPVRLAGADARFPFTTTIQGAWTKDTAGGNAHSSTYASNPQFSLVVQHKTCINLLLESKDDKLNVHVKLVHGKGQRVHAIRNRDIIFDSKDYRRGCCLADFAELDAGRYTIICSTFEAKQVGEFELVVESNYETVVQSLPREGAGKIRIQLTPVIFRPGDKAFIAQLLPRRLTKLYALARFADTVSNASRGKAPAPSLIRLALEAGRPPHNLTLAISNDGEHSNNAGGIRTGEIDLAPGQSRETTLWLVLDRMSDSAATVEETVTIDLFIDHPTAVTCGEWMASDQSGST